MFCIEDHNVVDTFAGGRYPVRHLYNPYQRVKDSRFAEINEDDGLGFLNFGKFFGRLLDKTPFEKIGKTVGRAMNIATPITWIRKDVREQALKDVITVAKRTPQIAIGAGVGFMTGSVPGAVAGAALAATSKGEGFKFKVFKSGILPGFTGGGLAVGGQAAIAGVKAGFTAAGKEGLLAGIKTGYGAFKETGIQLAKETPLGSLAAKFPKSSKILKGGWELGKEYYSLQDQGPLPPQGGMYSDPLPVPSGPLPFVDSSELPEYAWLDSSYEGVSEDPRTGQFAVEYSKLPEALAQSKDYRSLTDSQVNKIKNDFIQKATPSYKKNLEIEYTKILESQYRKDFENKTKETRLQIEQFKRLGGPHLQEAKKAEEELKRSWLNEWMPAIKTEVRTSVNTQASSLLEEQAEELFVKDLRQQSIINRQRKHQAKIDWENKNIHRLNVPAYASNSSRSLVTERSIKLDLGMPSQPNFLVGRADKPQPSFLVGRV